MKNLIATLAGFCAFGLLSTTPALGQAATDVNCDGCVHSGDIATNGVRRADIQNFSINTPKLNNFAVTTEKIKPGAVTESKIANDAVTPDKINATDVNYNTRYGEGALEYNTTGFWNSANGPFALQFNATGSWNTASGPYALYANSTGTSNTAIGQHSMYANTTGSWNTANGANALHLNTTADNNTANGANALYSNITGFNNTADGTNALNDNTTGYNNTGTGRHALNDNTTGSNNTALGAFAGLYYTTGDYNIVIGADNWGVADESYTTRIGDTAHQSRAFIAGIRGTTTGIADAVNVVIDANGQLGTISSSRRYKEDIQDMGNSSDRLLQLRPVTFRYKEAYENGEKPLDFGLIAEEVAEVFPELVVYNEEKQPETVKYRLLSTLLLNELQKQHQVNQQQDAQLAELVELRAQVAELSDMVIRMAQMKTPASELVARNAAE